MSFVAKRQRKSAREPEERLSRILDSAWPVSVLWGSGKVVFLHLFYFRKIPYGSSRNPCVGGGRPLRLRNAPPPKNTCLVPLHNEVFPDCPILCVSLCTLLLSKYLSWVLCKNHSWEAGLAVKTQPAPCQWPCRDVACDFLLPDHCFLSFCPP